MSRAPFGPEWDGMTHRELADALADAEDVDRDDDPPGMVPARRGPIPPPCPHCSNHYGHYAFCPRPDEHPARRTA